jgi:hypothetical protein
MFAKYFRCRLGKHYSADTIASLNLASTLKAENDSHVALPALRQRRCHLRQSLKSGDFIGHDPNGILPCPLEIRRHQAQDQQV